MGVFDQAKKGDILRYDGVPVDNVQLVYEFCFKQADGYVCRPLSIVQNCVKIIPSETYTLLHFPADEWYFDEVTQVKRIIEKYEPLR